MSCLEIDTYPAPVLKRRADLITNIDDHIIRLAQDMLETMYRAPGVGLAAPQIGQSLRLVVADPGDQEKQRSPITLINPEIILHEGQTGIVEGCLSVPGYTAEVSRSARILVRAYDAREKEIELELEGFPAIVLQHEIDHLNGVLFIDRISRLKRDIYERKRRKGTLDT